MSRCVRIPSVGLSRLGTRLVRLVYSSGCASQNDLRSALFRRQWVYRRRCRHALSDEELRKGGDHSHRRTCIAPRFIPTLGPQCSYAIREDSEAKLVAVAGDRYSYRELDDFTDLIGRTFKAHPKLPRSIARECFRSKSISNYSQERLAEYGLTPSNLKDILGARNITLPGGQLEVGPEAYQIDPSGKFTDPQQIGDVIIGRLPPRRRARSIFGIWWIFPADIRVRRYLNYLTWADKDRILAPQPGSHGRSSDERWRADRRIWQERRRKARGG